MTRGRNGEVVVPVADIRAGRGVPMLPWGTSRATADVEIVDEPAAVAASVVLERRSQSLRANPHLDREVAAGLVQINEGAIQELSSDPARAKKTTSVKSYELAC
jgi:hypothetical protein